MRPVPRLLLWLTTAALVLAALFVVALAVPVPSWRTGRLPAAPLDVVERGPKVDMPSRVWIDTDAACGAGSRTDPDDCFAIALLALDPGLQVVGLSTVFGNAALDVTDRTARALAGVLQASGVRTVAVHTGLAVPLENGKPAPGTPALAALRQALADGPLTIVALGPLTNVAGALDGRPDLQKNVARLVAVMGRRPGHIFHPAEGDATRMLLGHGPVFRDLNLIKDSRAAVNVLLMDLPITLVPYDVACSVSLTKANLERIGQAGSTQRWIVERSLQWLEFWRQDIGRDGFCPFDLLAAAYMIEPTLFNCAFARAWIGSDHKLWHDWFYSPDALLVDREPDRSSTLKARTQVIYCPQAAPDLLDWLVSRMGVSNDRHR